jgi:hypothetical protein
MSRADSSRFSWPVRNSTAWLLLVWVIAFLSTDSTWAQAPFAFRDVGNETGLFPGVANIAGQGVGWGDVNGDGWPDSYVASGTDMQAARKPSPTSDLAVFPHAILRSSCRTARGQSNAKASRPTSGW